MNKKYKVVGIGNAIVDVACLVEDQFLSEHNLTKGGMALISEHDADKLFHLKHQKVSSGGSIANSIATLSMLGVKTALIGKVGHDKFGDAFFDDLKKIGCDFYCKHKDKSGTTAKSYVLITPDGERTMCTYLGHANHIENEIDEKLIADTDLLYLEGYLWDTPETIASMREAIEIARDDEQTKIAFSLSDAFCVDRHRSDFVDLFEHLNILFANHTEMKLLLGDDFAENNYKKVQDILHHHNPNLIIAMTFHENGAVIFDGTKAIYQIPTAKIDKVVDATGAGDAFSAGFLYGFLQNLSLQKCAEIGNLLAGTVIQRIGARLDVEEVNKLKIKIS